jgi:hypothetical protein
MDNATSAAYVRLCALTDAPLMADIRLVCAELMHTRVELEQARAERDQAGRSALAANKAAELKEAELSDLKEHIRRVFGAVDMPSIVVRELLRRVGE